MLLIALAVLSAAAEAGASTLPDGVQVMRSGKDFVGYSLDANLAMRAPAAEAAKLIRGYAEQAAASIPDSKEGLENMTAAVASFLDDVLAPAAWKSNAQAFVTPFESDARPMILIVNVYKNATGEIFQYSGRFEPTLSGITDGVHSAHPVGLRVHARVVRQLDDENTPFVLHRQYVGAEHIEALSKTVDINEYLTRRDVTVTTYVQSWRKNEGRENAIAVRKDVMVVYSEARGLGAAANILVKAASPLLPKPFQDLACAGIDLSGEFGGPADRNQGQVGSCHVFAAVALLENGLLRSYRLKIPLSEQDLFEVYKAVQEGSLKIASPAYDLATQVKGGGFLTDGGQPIVDLALAKYFGLATGKTVPYTAGRKYFKGDAPPPPSKSTVEAERKITAEAFKALSVNLELFTPLDAGISQKYAVIKNLCAKRPVAVSMNVYGLPGFGEEKSKGKLDAVRHHTLHAFAIVGFERRLENGRETYVFKTRNSWGAEKPNAHPEIAEDEMWRIENFVSIDAKTSKAPAGLTSLPR